MDIGDLEIVEKALQVMMPEEKWGEEQHLMDTPLRFAKMMVELTMPEDFKFTTFENYENVDEMVVVKDIPFYTFCAHHIIPFFGVAHVAYVPGERIAGLSKFARAVQWFSRGLNVQEVLTQDITDWLEAKLEPKGVAVIMQAEHLCMTMRGAQVAGTKTQTACMKGVFADHTKTAKTEFLEAIRGH